MTDSMADPATVFTALANIVYQSSSLDEVYAAICAAATLMVPGCDHASVMVRRGDSYAIAAASDGVAATIDELEIALGEGPCMDAIEEEAAQIEPDLAADSQWPALAARIVAETPVRGSMGFRLLAERRKAGALNLFSDTPGAFDTAAAERAVVLAAFATIAIGAAVRGEEVDNLQRGLASNREIGKAIGMLMVLNDISEPDAFNLLRRISQDTNIRIADIAAEVVKRRGLGKSAP